MFEPSSDEFTVRVTDKLEEIKAFLETGFEYVCQKDNNISEETQMRKNYYIASSRKSNRSHSNSGQGEVASVKVEMSPTNISLFFKIEWRLIE